MLFFKISGGGIGITPRFLRYALRAIVVPPMFKIVPDNFVEPARLLIPTHYACTFLQA